MVVKLKIRGKRKKVKSPTLAKNRTARVGHPEAFYRIEGRPPAGIKARPPPDIWLRRDQWV